MGFLIASAKIGYFLQHKLHFLIFQPNMTVRCPLFMISVNHIHVPQSLRVFVEQVTPQGSGETCFLHLQHHGASSCLMRTGELADLMLTFSSIFCFKYLTCGILFILPLYEIFLIFLESLVHIRLSKSHCVYQELFFSLGIPMQLLCCCLLGENRNPPAREGKSPAYLFIFSIIFWRLKA